MEYVSKSDWELKGQIDNPIAVSVLRSFLIGSKILVARSISLEVGAVGTPRHTNDEKPGPDSVATEKSWTVSSSDITEGDHATELAFAAGTFAELMRRSPYTGGIDFSDLASYTKDVAGRGNKDEQELLSLIEQASRFDEAPSVVTR